MTGTSERNYGGATGPERRDRRREQLLAAGLEVFADRGWATATVLDVCRAAGLSQRYFYEAFANREALFGAVFDGIVAGTEDHAVRAFEATAGTPEERVGAVFGSLVDRFLRDPRATRVTLVESLAHPELRRRRHALLERFAALADRLEAALAGGPGVRARGAGTTGGGSPLPGSAAEAGTAPADADDEPPPSGLGSFVLVGGLAEVLTAAATGDRPIDRDALVAEMTAACLAAAARGRGT